MSIIDMKVIMSDPKVQAAIAELKGASPILARMGVEKAIEVVMDLINAKRRYLAIEELRRAASSEEWTAFCQSGIKEGNQATIDLIDDQEYVKKLFVSILVSVVLAAL